MLVKKKRILAEASWLFGNNFGPMAARPQHRAAQAVPRFAEMCRRHRHVACLGLSAHLSTGPQTFASVPRERSDFQIRLCFLPLLAQLTDNDERLAGFEC
jgi:hypothetical protein